MNTDYWLSYPSEYKKQLKPLLHQQMWLFGQDILHPKGNLLYRYEFKHRRAEKRGSSMYTREDSTQQIVLWGWGIWFGQPENGAIFVNRFQAKPQYTPVATLSQVIYQEDDLPERIYRARSESDVKIIQGLWVSLLTWLAEYEAWILEIAGKKWRQTSVKAFKHAVTKPNFTDTLPSQWQTLAQQSKTLPISTCTRTA